MHRPGNLVVALHEPVEHLDDLGHGTFRNLDPVGQLVVQFLLVPGGQLHQEGSGDFVFVCGKKGSARFTGFRMVCMIGGLEGIKIDV